METLERGSILKSPMKLGIAALAAAGLAFSAMTPAMAADYQLGPDEVIGFENGTEGDAGYNYDQWHVGSVYNSDLGPDASLEFGECAVTTLAVPANSEAPSEVTQVIKGFPIDARPSTTADIRAMIETIEIDVESGNVTLQLPFFEQRVADDGEVVTTWLGTFRNTTEFGPGVHTLGPDVPLTNETMNADALADWQNGDSLADFYAEMDDAIELQGEFIWYELLGIGFTGSEGAVVNSITFNGDTYYFGEGNCLPVAPDAPGQTAPTPPKAVETARQ